MNIKLYRQQNTIGGNIIEISTEKSRILLDCGKELDDNEVSYNKSMFEGCMSGVDAVFLTHYHQDHAGLLEHLPENIPVYAGECTERVLRVIIGRTNKAFSDGMTFAGQLQHGVSIRIKDITVTPFLCDHSAYDSYMLLVEDKNESVLYTGDFRSNGRKSYKSLLDRLPVKVNTLICEGTALGRVDKRNITESELEIKVREIISELPTDAPAFVLQSTTNIDRVVTMYRAAKASGRVFLEDIKNAEITCATQKNIPNPNTFSDVYAFITDGRDESHNALEQYRHRAGKDYMASHPFLMCVRSSMTNYLKKLSEKVNMNGGVLLYSIWNGYKDNPEMKEFLDCCTGLGLKIIDCHCSGHADGAAITELIQHTNPDSIIPVHTENAEWFGQQFPEINVITIAETPV